MLSRWKGNVTNRFISNQQPNVAESAYSSTFSHVFAAAVVYTYRSVPPKEEYMKEKKEKREQAEKLKSKY